MPRANTVLTCAYIDCKRRSDQRSFGQSHTLTADQLSSYSTWLKSPNDGVVCDHHYTLLRRQLVRQLKAAAAESTARMDELLSAAAAMADTSSSAEPSDSDSPVLPSHTVTVAIHTPLLPTSQRGCDPRQRKRIAFTCAMSGVTWTVWNRHRQGGGRRRECAPP